MKKWFVMIMMAGIVAQVLAQDATHSGTNSAAEVEIRKLEGDLTQMIVKGEWDQYAAQLMEDFERTDGSGSQDKAAVLAQLRSPQTKILDLSPEELKVRVYGDTAIVTGHFTLVQRRNGRVDTFFTRETEVFLKRNGRWMLASEHATSVTR